MQRGHFYRAHGAWHLRYRVNGKQVSVKLADCKDEYRTLKNVRPLAERYLQAANSGQQADLHLTLQQYAETVYFPHARKNLKPSTYKGYFNLYKKQIQPRIGGLRLLICKTHEIQRVLWTINEEEELGHQSFLNINSVLSAIFTHARRTGMLQGPNPTDDVDIPEGKRRTGKTHKYALEEVEKITAAVGGVARCAVVVAAWTGLSLAELRGLKWEDIDFEKKQLSVARAVWHGEIIETKTEHRAAAVPLLENVITELKKHREQSPGTTWVFEGPRVFPLDLATLGSKHIKKALRGTGIEWHGFHAFRRGLGTRLYNNGTPLPTIGRILRHGSESEVTMKHYVDVEEETKAAALENLPRKQAAKKQCPICEAGEHPHDRRWHSMDFNKLVGLVCERHRSQMREFLENQLAKAERRK
jgi:integrase